MVRSRSVGVVLAGFVLASCAASPRPASLASSPSPRPAPADVRAMFIRETANGVVIRVFSRGGGLWIELSTDATAGLATVGTTGRTGPVKVVGLQSFGLEMAPASYVAVDAGPEVAEVRARFADGISDVMAPVKGWAVLARMGVNLNGKIEARDASGQVLAEVALPPAPAPSFLSTALTRLFLRTTADGVAIRGYSSPSAGLVVSLSTPGAISLPPGEQLPRPRQGPLIVSRSGLFGETEGDPAGWVTVATGSEIARVRMVFDDGASDEMVPVQGWAVVARRGSRVDGRIEGLDRTGRVVASASAQDACGPGQSTPNCSLVVCPSSPSPPVGVVDPTRRATGSRDVVMRVTLVGGFRTIYAELAGVPSFTLYGDGTIVAVEDSASAPVIPQLWSARLTPAEVDEILRRAVTVGLAQGPRSFPLNTVEDAATTRFVLNLSERAYTTDVYALGWERQAPPPAGDPCADNAQRLRLAEFADWLQSLPSSLGGTDQRRLPYAITRAAVVSFPVRGGDASRPVVSWPLEDLATWGSPLSAAGPVPARCGVALDNDFERVRAEAARVQGHPSWQAPSGLYDLLIRPLLPDEASCP